MTRANEPAFPSPPGGSSFTGDDGYTTHQFPGSRGMFLREHFAGLAMQGLRCSMAVGFSGMSHGTIAALAVRDADALLAELAKPQAPEV